jgi:alcohol dehydrogenase YqhD (iron-dependent ADH family)
MRDFVFYAPTKVFFGQNQLDVLGEQILPFGKKVLLVYGKGSIKRTGLFDAVTSRLTDSGIDYVELGGVDPNPRISTVREGGRLCREHDVQFVLAVGGGSVIDCAKGIAFAAFYDGDPWDHWIGKTTATQALPIGTVLTLAATGSEMNWGSVITNEATEEKRGKGSPLFRPQFSILDPTLTFTVPAYQTAAGVVDIMSHVYEFYFSPERGAMLQDSFAEALMRVCITYGPIAIKEPDNYEARANLMWASSMALNGVISRGKSFEGLLHGVEHAVSALYDLTHGVGLAILAIPWMEYILDENTLWKFLQFARNVWHIDGPDTLETARMGIAKTQAFYQSLGIPLTFSDAEIGSERFDDILDRCFPDPNAERGNLRPLNRQDVLVILEKAL